MKIRFINATYRLSPTIARFTLLNFLVFQKLDTLTNEYSIILGVALAFSIFFSFDLHHRLMTTLPKLRSLKTRCEISRRHLAFQLFLSFFGASFLILLKKDLIININTLVVFSFYISEHFSLEIPRILRANNKIVEGSQFDFFKTFFLIPIILSIISVDELNINSILLSYTISSLLAYLVLQRNNPEIIPLIKGIGFNTIKLFNRKKLTKKTFRLVLLLTSTFSLRYIQVLDREILSLRTDPKTTTMYILFLGIGMFCYRFIESWRIQFITPKLISIQANQEEFKNVFRSDLKKTMIESFLVLTIIAPIGYVFILLIRPEFSSEYIKYMPFVLLSVLTLIWYLTTSLVLYCSNHLISFSSIRIALFLSLLFFTSSMFKISSIKEISLIISIHYLTFSTINLLWSKIKMKKFL